MKQELGPIVPRSPKFGGLRCFFFAFPSETEFIRELDQPSLPWRSVCRSGSWQNGSLWISYPNGKTRSEFCWSPKCPRKITCISPKVPKIIALHFLYLSILKQGESYAKDRGQQRRPAVIRSTELTFKGGSSPALAAASWGTQTTAGTGTTGSPLCLGCHSRTPLRVVQEVHRSSTASKGLICSDGPRANGNKFRQFNQWCRSMSIHVDPCRSN